MNTKSNSKQQRRKPLRAARGYAPAIRKLKSVAAELRVAALNSYKKNYWWDGQACNEKATALEVAVIVLSR